jgi:hypothetical protein
MKPIVILAIAVYSGPIFAQSDTDVLRKIRDVERYAEAIEIDGVGSDWSAIPKIYDLASDSSDGSDREITAVAIAPLRDELLILIETEGAPTTQPKAFRVDVDVMGHWRPDFSILAVAGGTTQMASFKVGRLEDYQDAPRVQTAIDQAVEIRIPYDDLRERRPEEERRLIANPSERPWIRAFVSVQHSTEETHADVSPSVGSYILSGIARLDPPLAKSGHEAAVVPPPLRRRFFISQGAFGKFSHADKWSYDLSILNEYLEFTPKGWSTDNEDFYGWNRPILAPTGGKVIRVRSDGHDLAPSSTPKRGSPANEVYYHVDDSTGLWFAHLRQDSVRVAAGESVIQEWSWPGSGIQDIRKGLTYILLRISCHTAVRQNPWRLPMSWCR